MVIRLQRKAEPARVDVERDATEVIALESFRPQMSREIERGERFPRDHDLAKTFPQFFGLLLPLTELEEVSWLAIVKPSTPKIHPQVVLQPKPKIIKAPRK